MTAPIFYQWAAVALIFLISSIWSEENVRFGYVVVPIFAGIFWWIGWIQFAYLAAVIPILLFMGIFSYMRAQLKVKWGVFGSGSGILPKIIAFVVFLQFAVILVNGMMIFNTATISNSAVNNTFTSYSIEKAQDVYGSSTANMNIIDVVTNGLTFVWTSFTVFWQIVFSFFQIYGTMVNVFHVPAAISAVISAGIYLLTAIEVFVLIFKPYRAPEV